MKVESSKEDKPLEQVELSGQPPSFWSVIGSVFAAFFGVQKGENLSRDFKKGDPFQYVIWGVVGALLLISLVILLVKCVLS